MRPLSARAATACEQATSTRCRCRCGGAFHGAARFADPEAAYMLDDGDPHLGQIPAARGRQLRLTTTLLPRPAPLTPRDGC